MTLQYENELERPEILTEAVAPFSPEEIAERTGQAVLEKVDCPYEATASLLITDDASIRDMNRQFRSIDRETDVLSFPMLDFIVPGDFTFLDSEENWGAYFEPESGELLLGDIVISAPRCLAQAKAYGHSVLREFAFLVAHSMLHLCGYDHIDPEEEKEMNALQEEILAGLGYTR